MAKKHIVIIGNVGVGKTTLMGQLEKAEQTELILADELYLTNPFFPLSKQDPARWVFTNNLWFFVRRAEMTTLYFSAESTKNVVIDSGVWMSYVYAKAHNAMGWMSQQEWELFEDIFDHYCSSLPHPDLVILLDAPFQVLRERIEQRNRAFEVDGYFDYLKGISTGLQQLIQKLHTMNISLLSIDTATRTPEEVAAEVIHVIKER